MSGDNGRALEIAGAIADGSLLDWDHLDGLADDAVRELRIIAEIAAIHRGLPTPASITETASQPGLLERPDLSKAERWGPLLLLERVGGGAFGEVYRAWDPALDHEVALKLLRVAPRAPSSSSDLTTEPAASSVVREGQLLARVRHPNVITVHGALEVNGQVGVWMDFLRGRTLDQVVRDEGPMSAAETAVVGDSLCRAVAAVHRVGLLHRDIKASNVMREAGGRIVLLDFGAGSELALASTPTARRIAGTPLYLAPELFEGAGPSVSSDIYSLGVLLFYLVTGRHPVSGRSLDEICAAHRAGRRALLFELRPDLPGSFIAVVDRALSPEPADRYQSAGAMLRELAATVPSQPAPKPEVERRSVTWVISAAGVGVGVLLLVTMLGYFTSAMFNMHLGITADFISEGPLTYAALGAQNLVPTLFYMGVAVLLFYTGAAMGDVLTTAVPALARLLQRVRARWRAGIRPLKLDDPARMAKVVCAVGAAAFAAICWTFRDVLKGITSRIDVTPLETLSVLNPAYESRHDLFGLSLDMLLLMLLLALFQVLRARGTAGRPIGPVLGIVALAGLALLFHAGAWRILYRNEFRQATFENQPCYVLARRVDELLVHCPQMPVPRNRVVGQTDSRLVFTGRVEQLSRAFNRGASDTAR
jgi:hypothetical protein